MEKNEYKVNNRDIITSTANNQIKRLIALKNKSSARKKEKVFIVEGIKMYLETPKDKIEHIYIKPLYNCF